MQKIQTPFRDVVKVAREKSGERGARGHPARMVRVLNPNWLGRLLGESHESVKAARLEGRPGTPRTVAELGGLTEIAVEPDAAGTETIRALNLRVTFDQYGDQKWRFNPKQVRLVADANGDLHIVGFFLKPPANFQLSRSRLIGRAVAVTYRTNDGNNYEHEFCAHGGECPKLYFKDGYLLFRGGTYAVTQEGLLG
jgi:hypothetical protein